MKHFCSWVGSRKYYIFTIVVCKNIVQIRRVNNFVHKKITFSNAILSDNHFIYFASSPLNVTLVKPLRQRQFCNYVTLLFLILQNIWRDSINAHSALTNKVYYRRIYSIWKWFDWMEISSTRRLHVEYVNFIDYLFLCRSALSKSKQVF